MVAPPQRTISVNTRSALNFALLAVLPHICNIFVAASPRGSLAINPPTSLAKPRETTSPVSSTNGNTPSRRDSHRSVHPKWSGARTIPKSVAAMLCASSSAECNAGASAVPVYICNMVSSFFAVSSLTMDDNTSLFP